MEINIEVVGIERKDQKDWKITFEGKGTHAFHSNLFFLHVNTQAEASEFHIGDFYELRRNHLTITEKVRDEAVNA